MFLCFNGWKTADIQAHSAAPSAALRACRSAIFERNRENVCKPLDILTRFYECLLNARSAIFLRIVNSCSNLWIHIFQGKLLQLKSSLWLDVDILCQGQGYSTGLDSGPHCKMTWNQGPQDCSNKNEQMFMVNSLTAFCLL